MTKSTKSGRKPTQLKAHGGKRKDSGRPEGIVKGRKSYKQIQINLETYNQLKKLKGNKT
jgi:hypothetical protein